MSDAREWADAGIAELVEDIKPDDGGEIITAEEAAALMRAAYAEGYIAALSAEGADAPEERRRAWERAEELRLTIPVG